MRFLIITGDYPAFMDSFYTANPEIRSQPYANQLQARHDSLYGDAAFYVRNLRKSGHEAWDVRFNDEVMQLTWARENGMTVAAPVSTAQTSRGSLLRNLRAIANTYPLRYFRPLMRPLARRIGGTVMYDVLRAQIQAYKPDVIVNHFMEQVQDDFLASIRPQVRFIVGQIAAPLPAQQTYRSYDLVVSSLPNYVDYFRGQGICSELCRLGFEPSVLERLGPQGPARYGVTFVGSLSRDHANRLKLLELMCASTDIDIWGQHIGSVSKDSKIHRRYHGVAWGADMYRILRSSRITLNHHIGIADNYANNLRLFEATGVGTMLLTDAKINLPDLFVVDREVVTYITPEECCEKVQYYLAHDTERQAIALAGQRRTLAEHNYYGRMQDLLGIVDSYLRRTSHGQSAQSRP